MKDKVIGDSVLSSTPGQPSTYPSSAAGLADFTGSKNFATSSSGTTTADISQSITTGETESSSQSYNNSFELKVGFSAGVDGVFPQERASAAEAAGATEPPPLIMKM